jgi:integrase
MPVYKRGNSYWIAFAINRRRYRKRSPDNSYQGAQAYEALIRQRLARGQPLEEPKPEKQYRFRDIALEWLEVTVKNNNKPSDYSIKKYLFNAHILPYLGNRYLEQIDCYTIEQYKALLIKKGYSEKTINNHLSIINCCFKAAIERNIIKNSPRVKLLKVLAPPYDLLTESEVMQLINHSNGKWHNIILLVVRTGLRIGEVLALKW